MTRIHACTGKNVRFGIVLRLEVKHFWGFLFTQVFALNSHTFIMDTKKNNDIVAVKAINSI